MLGNGPDPTCTTHPNGVGDCTFAGRQHYRMAKAAAENETETWEASNDLVKEYLSYDHGKDEGANIADLLLHWYKAGKIVAFAPLDHTNAAEVDAAMAAFHGAYVGVNLTDDADQLFGQGQPWTVANGEQADANEGHCIVKVKADGSQLDGWVTWGAVQESTLDWTKACLDEAWVIITTGGHRGGQRRHRGAACRHRRAARPGRRQRTRWLTSHGRDAGNHHPFGS